MVERADEYEFTFEPIITDYTTGADLSGFDCGNDDINEFLHTDQVQRFHEYRLGHTRLVYDNTTLAGFFTLAPYSFQSDAFDGSESDYAAKLQDEDGLPPAVPSRLVGQLGVDRSYQGQDLGKYLMRYIIAETLELDSEIPFRFLVLHAHEDVVGFYTQFGFVESNSGKDNSWEHTIMFLDLKAFQ